MKIDIVIPVYNEQPSIALLIDEIEAVSNSQTWQALPLLVDDGSNDGSWDEIRGICQENPNVRGIRLARNFGKTAALAAAFACCQSEIVFTMDADLQDDPAEIPGFLEKMGGDLTLVCGWKKTRKDGIGWRIMSQCFNSIVNLTTGLRIHDHNCGFKAIRSDALELVWLDRGMHRFLPVMISAGGGRVDEVIVNHRQRQFGKSKYGLARVFRGLWDLGRVLYRTGFGRHAIDRDKVRPPAEIEIVEQLNLGNTDPAAVND